MTITNTALAFSPERIDEVDGDVFPNAGVTDSNLWIATTEALPEEGGSVEFILEYRDIAMSGVYSRCLFLSRWARYAPALIREWRYAERSAQ